MVDTEEQERILTSLDLSKEILEAEFTVMLNLTQFGDIEMSDEEE
jgi:hypothetical protein